MIMSDAELSFLKDLIERNWFQEIDEGHPHHWTFRDDLSKLKDEQFGLVVQLCLQAIDADVDSASVRDAICLALRQGQLVRLADKDVSLDLLEKVLVSMTIAEYRLDALALHPPAMRFREIDEISAAVGLDTVTLILIDRNWHERLRQRVFPQSLI